jgi:predicted TIM-barrel fold metal-dependent hydrolase
VIIDFHTHVFPPDVLDHRSRYVLKDATFAELYGSETAKLASAGDLLRSMDTAGIDVSVALGFAWRDKALCRVHNDYLLASAAASGGRILPFCTLPLAAGAAAVAAEAKRCAAAGTAGFGELRPENAGIDLDDEGVADALADAAGQQLLLFHVSEPVGHSYPGKRGFDFAAFYRFLRARPQTRVVGAHWGGGLPLYALMPEVKLALANVAFDTAATSLLYEPNIYRTGVALIGADHVLFGSDFPLLSQSRSRRQIEQAGLEDADLQLILGGNAGRLLGFE